MNNPLSLPLVLVADDTPSEIANRVRNTCALMRAESGLAPAAWDRPGSLTLQHLEIKWSRSPNAADYLALAGCRRTLVLLDVVWTGLSETQGLTIARELLADPEFAARSVVVLKSTDRAGSAASWVEPVKLAMRQLRVSGAVRLRLLATDRSVGGETNRYEQGIIAQALLDLQEEAIFDAIRSGEWSAAEVGAAIAQIEAADFYGAFAGDKALGRLYLQRVLRRYHQRPSPNYPMGPLNLGVARLMGSKPPVSLRNELDNLTSTRAPESAAIVSALLDYGELASAERLLFALPLRDNTGSEIKTNFDEQTWKPDKIASAGTIRRRCDLGEARKALEELRTALKFCQRDGVAPLARLERQLHPAHTPETLELNRLMAELRSSVLLDLPAAIVELIESLLGDIERALVEGVAPDFDGLIELRAAHAPEILTLDWNFKDGDQLDRFKSEHKRVRLLNRRLFEHPAVEASRILQGRGGDGGEKGSLIIDAFKAYVQSPEAIAALVALHGENPVAAKQCIRALDTDAGLRLPADSVTFDGKWRAFCGDHPRPVLRTLQRAGAGGPDLERMIQEWNRELGGALFVRVTLLELLVAHLAVLEYRIRAFCVIIGNAPIEAEKKSVLAENLSGLWQSRGWDRIFPRNRVVDADRGAWDPGVRWTGKLLDALCEQPRARDYYAAYHAFLENYEVEVLPSGRGQQPELRYRTSLPPWLRVGNLVLPLEFIQKNLGDRRGPLPEGKQSATDTEQLADDYDRSDVRDQVDDTFVQDLRERARNGDRRAAGALITECGWTQGQIDRLMGEN